MVAFAAGLVCVGVDACGMSALAAVVQVVVKNPIPTSCSVCGSSLPSLIHLHCCKVLSLWLGTVMSVITEWANQGDDVL